MTSNVINDGYTRDGYIAPIEGIHEGLEFTYRPMLPGQVEDLDVAIGRKNGDAGVTVMAAGIARQLVSWSEVSRDKKEPVVISHESVRRLPHPLLTSLHRIVTGIRASDPRPQAIQTDQSTSDYAKELDEVIAGKAPGDAVDADRKN